MADRLDFAAHLETVERSETYRWTGTVMELVGLLIESTGPAAAIGDFCEIFCSDGRRIRTPGLHDESVDPMPEAEALAFLLSHSFPGHRRVLRPMSIEECRRIRLAAWADSVSERMALVDRIWRALTEPVLPPSTPGGPELVQVVQLGGWAYPVYLDGSVTRVLPPGGIPVGELTSNAKKVFDLDRKSAQSA